MEVTYKRHLSQSFMILTVEDGPDEPHELEMLSYNQVPGLLPLETEFSDGKVRFWYDITGRQTMMDYLGRHQVDSHMLGLMLETLEKICGQLENYMLEEDGLLLAPEYMYLDFDQKTLAVAYLPGAESQVGASFQSLMEIVLQNLDHGDKQAVSMAYELYQLSLQGGVPLGKLLGQRNMDGHMDEPESTLRQQDEDDALEAEFLPVQGSRWHKDEERADKKWAASRLRERLGKIKTKEDEPMYAESASPMPVPPNEPEIVSRPTEILRIDQDVQGILRYQGEKDLTDIEIDRPVFLIGKKEKEVDACINMKCVSRVHAKIEMEQGEYYLEDMNSTNGTYLNGERLEYRQKAKLEPRDRVGFGLIEYVFL